MRRTNDPKIQELIEEYSEGRVGEWRLIFHEDDLNSFIEKLEAAAREDERRKMRERVEMYLRSWKEPEWAFERHDTLQKWMSDFFNHLLSSLTEEKEAPKN